MRSRRSMSPHSPFRRRAAAIAAVAALSVVTAGCSAGGDTGDGTTKTIRIYAAHYTPTESMEVSDDNPYPREMLRVIADEWTKKSGVKVDIVEMPASATDERTWALTQLNSGDAPEIMNTQAFYAEQDKANDWWLPLDGYLAEPNEYIADGDAGSDKWIEEFSQLPLEVKRDSDGELYVLPFDLVTTMFFYNKTAFAEAGITDAPTTYADFLDDLAALKDKTDYVPVSPFSFSKLQLGEQLVSSWKENMTASGAGGSYTMEDVTRAILDGTFNADSPEYRSWLTLLKEAQPYWSADWAVDGTDWGQRFTEGKLAILEDGTWRYGMLDSNDELGFDWGTFFMPTVTTGTGEGESVYSDEAGAPSIGGATGLQLGITSSATKNGLVDEAVDFLKYLSAPDQMERMVGELGQYLPTAVDAAVNPLLEEPLKVVSNGVGEAGMILYYDKVGLDAQISLQNITTEFLQGSITLDEAATQSQDAYMTAAKTNAETNGWSE